MSSEQMIDEEQKTNWLEEHYGQKKQEEEIEKPQNPQIQKAVDFIAHHNWAECRLTFLERRCLNITSLMDKFFIEPKDKS